MNFRRSRALAILSLVTGLACSTPDSANAAIAPSVYGLIKNFSFQNSAYPPSFPEHRNAIDLLIADDFDSSQDAFSLGTLLPSSDPADISSPPATLLPSNDPADAPSSFGTLLPNSDLSERGIAPEIGSSDRAIPLPNYRGDKSLEPSNWSSEPPLLLVH